MNSTRPLDDCEASNAGGKSLSSATFEYALGMDLSIMDRARTNIMSSSSTMPPSLANSSNSAATTKLTADEGSRLTRGGQSFKALVECVVSQGAPVMERSLPMEPSCVPAEISMSETRETPAPEPTQSTKPVPPVEAADAVEAVPLCLSAYDEGVDDRRRLAHPTPFFNYTELSKPTLRKLRREIVVVPNQLWQCEMRRIPVMIDPHGCAAFILGFNLRDLVLTGPKSLQKLVLTRFLSERADLLAVPFRRCKGPDKPGIYLACRGQQRHPHFSANGRAEWPDMTVYGPSVMILAMCTLLILDASATAHVSNNLLPMLRSAHEVLSNWQYETDVGRDISVAYQATELRCLERVVTAVEWAQSAALNLPPMQTLVTMLNAGHQALMPPVVLSAATHKRVLRKLERGQLLTVSIPGREPWSSDGNDELSDTQSTLAVFDDVVKDEASRVPTVKERAGARESADAATLSTVAQSLF